MSGLEAAFAPVRRSAAGWKASQPGPGTARRRYSRAAWIKHHPANLMAMPDAVVHGRLHGKYKGLPRYSPPERLWVGSPPWVKKAGAMSAGHSALGREAERRR
jgi:hypothetical protein